MADEVRLDSTFAVLKIALEVKHWALKKVIAFCTGRGLEPKTYKLWENGFIWVSVLIPVDAIQNAEAFVAEMVKVGVEKGSIRQVSTTRLMRPMPVGAYAPCVPAKG